MSKQTFADRRTLLKSALATAPLFTAGRLYAADMSGPRLLVVFLRGAYDAANLLVPTGSPFYYESRPNIAIAVEQMIQYVLRHRNEVWIPRRAELADYMLDGSGLEAEPYRPLD